LLDSSLPLDLMAPLPEDAYQEHPHARTGANGQRPESDRSHQQPSEESRDDPVHHGYGAGYGQGRCHYVSPTGTPKTVGAMALAKSSCVGPTKYLSDWGTTST
jgi:hypothetical protein